ncbi:MAG: hypothetical protein ACI8W3_002773 [Myxococcota bacterium]|jgi:hypothetical protein
MRVVAVGVEVEVMVGQEIEDSPRPRRDFPPLAGGLAIVAVRRALLACREAPTTMRHAVVSRNSIDNEKGVKWRTAIWISL